MGGPPLNTLEASKNPVEEFGLLEGTSEERRVVEETWKTYRSAGGYKSEHLGGA